MRHIEQPPQPEKKDRPFTPNDIFSLREQFNEDVRTEEERSQIGNLARSNFPEWVRLRNEIQDRVSKAYVEKLLKEPQKFGAIFQSSSGSHYFVLHSGECWRFRQESGKGLVPQVVSGRILYIPETRAQEMLTALKKDQEHNSFRSILADSEFLSSLIPAPGLVPLELGRSHVEEPCFEPTTHGTLRLVGKKNPKNGAAAPISSRHWSISYHIGNTVEHIIYAHPDKT